MIALILTALVGHANARPKQPPTLPEFYGTYHGLAQPTSVTERGDREVFSLILDEGGVTIPYHARQPGRDEVIRTWMVHYPEKTHLVPQDQIPNFTQTSPDALCLGLRASPWSEITDVVCFHRRDGKSPFVEFSPRAESSHVGRASLVRDPSGSMVAPETLRAGPHAGPITPTQSTRAMEIFRIDFPSLSFVQKMELLNEIGKGFESSSPFEKLFTCTKVIRPALEDSVWRVRLTAMQQVALYVQTDALVDPVRSVLANHGHGSEMLVVAVDAAEALLEKIEPFVQAEDHLARHHGKFAPGKLYALGNGRLDPADFRAIRLLESERGLTKNWVGIHKKALMDVLTDLGEDRELEAPVRRRALEVARRFSEPKRTIQDYLVNHTYMSMSSIPVKAAAQRLVRMFDGNVRDFLHEAAKVSVEPIFERYFRERLGSLYMDHVIQPLTPHQARCDELLAELAESQ